jgi:prevent-host-death family protein
MCYMAERARGHVGVRELRQNLSVYLDRVKAGESLTVTERGAEVARIVPMPAGGSTIDVLIADGRARPASGDLVELGVPPAIPGDPLSETLRRVRDEEDG